MRRPEAAGVALLLAAVPIAYLGADERAADALNRFGLRHDGFVSAMRLISDIGSGPVYYALFGLIAIALAWRRQWRTAAYVVVTMQGSALLNMLAKAAFDRSRPAFEVAVLRTDGLSFPSGHAQSAVVACAVLLAVTRTRRRAAFAAAAVFVFAVGFSRVALGVHYVSDVLGGYALGAAWAIAMTAAFRLSARGSA